MRFRTEIPIEKFPFELNHQSKVLLMGSCFSDNIGQKLIQGGFNAVSNPFGVLYNPISIKNGLKIMLEQKCFSEKDLFLHQGLYHSFYHHSSFSNSRLKETLHSINESIQSHKSILDANPILFLTFGTAFVYKHLKNNEIVSNCHKLPAKEFEHYMLNVAEIVLEYSSLIEALKSKSPEIKIVFTISPIRHWKDGAHQNQLSKASLHLAIFQIQKKFDNVFYYPSYELVMDDLRDYRFYSEDLIHLNQQAVNYIYQHFKNCFFTEKTVQIEERVLKLKQALNHRAFQSESEEYQKFIKNTQQKIEHLKNEFPEISW